MQIEHVRVEREHRGRGDARRPRPGQREHDPRDGAGRDGERRDRNRDRRRAGAVEEIDLHRQRIQQVRQRQPDGADLLPAGRDAVDDAPRDDEMAARVVVAERQAERDGSATRRRAASRRRSAIHASSAFRNRFVTLSASRSGLMSRRPWPVPPLSSAATKTEYR